MRVFYLIALCLLMSVPTSAQESETSLYLLTEQEEDYQIAAFNPVANYSEVLFSVAKTQQGILSQVFPADEIDALTTYLSTIAHNTDFSRTEVNASIRAISASPDNTQVIAVVTYERQYNPHQPRFGTTQLVLINREDNRQRVLLNLGFHNVSHLSHFSTSPYLFIYDVQWMPDQQSVIISITDAHHRVSPPQFAFLEITIETASVTKITEGITWAAAPSSDQIVILQQENRLPNTLAIVDLHHPDQSVRHELGAWSIAIDTGLAYWGSSIVLSVAYDGSQLEGGGGLAIFNTSTNTASMLLPDQLIQRIESSPDGSHLIVETAQGHLMQLQEIEGRLQLTPILAYPVFNWHLDAHGNLWIQYTEGEAYQSQVIDQEFTYRYSYLEITPYGDSALIHTIDPQHPDQLATTYPYPLPQGWVFSPRIQSVVSPDGKWIASPLLANNHTRLMIYLLNVDTWQGIPLIEGVMTNSGHNIAWSPDSQALAINIQEMNQQDSDIFIYELESENLVDLSNDTAQQRDMSWSNDNRYLLTFTRPCTVSENCPTQLSLYDVENSHQIKSVELTELPFLGDSACNPNLSPNSQLVALTSNCGVDIPFSSDFPNEIYNWDITRNQLTQVTSYAQGEIGLLARYQYEWLNDDLLLIGANYRNSEGQEQQQLSLFQLEDKRSIPLATNIGAGFILAPTRDQILLQSRLFYANQAIGQDHATLEFSVIATLEDGNYTMRPELQFLLEQDSICDSSWSPSGELVVITLSANDCVLYLENLIFLSPNSPINIQGEINAIPQSPNKYYVPLGWLQD